MNISVAQAFRSMMQVMQIITFRLFVIVWLVQASLIASSIETFYGAIEIEEPVLLELIESPAFQRLKHIHQYGVMCYTLHIDEDYTRYDHSLGVLAILRANNASLDEQVAGILHDVSHTVFSHVGDWIFDVLNSEKDYQNSIHAQFLIRSGLEQILNKHHFTVDQILPLEELFPMLEQKCPDLCADRIDYNIQGAFYRGYITLNEAMEMFADLKFEKGRWFSTRVDLMEKIGRSSLILTQTCWGGATNHLLSSWLAEAILRAVELGELSVDDINFGTDQNVWDRLVKSGDYLIKRKMEMLLHVEDYFSETDPSESDMIVKSKFRGIDPWILFEGKKQRLTTCSPIYGKDFAKVKDLVELGVAIQLNEAGEVGHKICK
ncbi:MAG: HD domain-containing protein [Parachlamydiaceae bacterium]|nr:HD domain-containing protein [Parachlamydiaceae bacterium]